MINWNGLNFKYSLKDLNQKFEQYQMSSQQQVNFWKLSMLIFDHTVLDHPDQIFYTQLHSLLY